MLVFLCRLNMYLVEVNIPDPGWYSETFLFPEWKDHLNLQVIVSIQ